MARKIKKVSGLPNALQIKEFIENSKGSVGRREIARAFNIKGSQRIALKQYLRQLVAEGSISLAGRKRVSAPGNLPPVTVLEVLKITDDGSVFARPVKNDAIDPNLKVSISLSSKGPSFAEGDKVLAKTSKISTNFYSATVLRRLDNTKTKILGIIKSGDDKLRVVPVSGRRSEEAVIDTNGSKELKDGDLVEVEIQQTRSFGLKRAKVINVLSHENDQNLISLISINEFDIPTEFTPEAISLAEQAQPVKISNGREDLRDINLITVDGEDARDFDDAIWAEEDKNPHNSNGWRMIVAIADVAHYVSNGDPLDIDARKRGNSVYFADRVVPMLPENLSNGLCSLKPHEDRGCLAVEIIIDQFGHKKSHRFIRGVMRSKARLTYEQLEETFNGNKNACPPEIMKLAKSLRGAYNALSDAREKRGALNIETAEKVIKINDNGKIDSILPRERLESHKVIEEFMVTANVCAAETLEEKMHTCVYRIHDVPSEDKIHDLRENLTGFGYKLAKGQVLRPKLFNQILSKAKGTDSEETINQLVLRSQSQAEYSISNVGHFGLALARYAHFTSPIRRYSDLLVHRALIAASNFDAGKQYSIADQQLEDICKHISQTERRAATAERAANDRYLASFMKDKVGQTFNATISGVKKFGVFVTIGQENVDALLPTSKLPADYYRYDERRQTLAGRHNGLVLGLGQKIHVILKTADAITGRLAVEYAGESSSYRNMDHLKAPNKTRSKTSKNRRGKR